MIHSQMEKVVATLPATGSSAVTLVADMLGYDYASFTVLRGSNASTVFASVLKIEESDDNSSYANVSGFVGGTDYTIPTVTDTAGTSVVKLDVDCKARKRYLKVTATPAASMPVAVTGRLSRGAEAPATASEAGVLGWVKG
jgi:hypothetical protein